MKIQKRYLIGAPLILFALLGIAIFTAQAQTGGGYDLTWNTLEGGGHSAAADGSYRIDGNFGQVEAGVTLTGGAFSLTGGFWGGIPAYSLFLPTIFR